MCRNPPNTPGWRQQERATHRGSASHDKISQSLRHRFPTPLSAETGQCHAILQLSTIVSGTRIRHETSVSVSTASTWWCLLQKQIALFDSRRRRSRPLIVTACSKDHCVQPAPRPDFFRILREIDGTGTVRDLRVSPAPRTTQRFMTGNAFRGLRFVPVSPGLGACAETIVGTQAHQTGRVLGAVWRGHPQKPPATG